ncbi:MAG: ABC transporter ATP-binding protein [Clostridia bacterium]|nr:ABC transporter ATP-binding protein [Clostridia bacterium]
MSVLIQTHNLVKRYGSLYAVNDVSITIESGAIVGLVGRNGAGKTTLIRLLTGLAKPTSGSFEVMPGDTRLDTSVAAIVERPSVYVGMTGMENLKAQSLLLGLPIDEEYLKSTLKLVGLDPTLKKKAKDYSLGMRQRLAIAMTLVGKPKLLILDEPTNGLDPQGIHDMRELFVKLNQQFGVTLLVSSHILTELGRFATEFYFMEKGRIIKHATAEEIASSSQKRLRVTVDDVQKALEAFRNFAPNGTADDDAPIDVASALDEQNANQAPTSNGIDVRVVGPNVIEIFDDLPATQVLLVLAQNGVVATNVVTIGDDLESYYISLLNGGGQHA